MIIFGNLVTTTTPRPDYAQSDPNKGNFIFNRPNEEIRRANETANAALARSGGKMTGPIDMNGQVINNLPVPTENAHPATKGYVDNHKVDRAHLAEDALFSPVKASGNATQYYFVESDLGKTIMPSSGADSSDITYILSDTLANAIPYGAEIAVCFRFGKSLKIKFEGEIYSAMPGDSGMQKAKTYQIPERYGMVALKKINYTDSYTSWLVTGNVEVVG